MHLALLIIDPQNDLFEADNPNLPAFEATVPVINDAIALAREQNWSLIFIQHTSERKPAGSQPWEINERFDCRVVDVRLGKTHENAFWNTGLDALLRSQRVDMVVVAGYVAERCVLSTVRGAAERGYRAALLDEAIAGLDDRFTQFTLDISPRVTLEALRAMSGS
ncbi:cysteine hydrolase family protein [Promineifilum sp.]|uniref:cysteine hydrolase family protein n=1 Tax=Promineifilum sp. TaxID=2664178 RepID=UPI0035B14168